MDILSATGVKNVFLALMDGESTRIMALQLIKIDLSSATGIKENFFIHLKKVTSCLIFVLEKCYLCQIGGLLG